MGYFSTRDKNISVTAAEAIKTGISPEGGLFVPKKLPQTTENELLSFLPLSYTDRAVFILSKYLKDYTENEIKDSVKKAYGEKFDTPEIAPVKKLDNGLFCLELWHGPTYAFKDMALQLLPYLLTNALKKTGETKTAVILTATSGDTGKAALEGFHDVNSTKIAVYYPGSGVSPIQQLQMTSQKGENVSVCGIKGNFDDAQNGVKELFTDPKVNDRLEKAGYFLTSANSINWGRLVPQIVYYFSAYCDLVNKEDITFGQKVNFVVPTGNFGNILAGYYALKMGLPINKLICASNKNNVLTDFILNGVYNRNRRFFATASPSMDILVSSNLERLLFDILDENDTAVSDLMHSLKEQGYYSIGNTVLTRLKKTFDAGYADETACRSAIQKIFQQYGYLCDTHTAVAFSVYMDYKRRTEDSTPSVVLSTASPYKFAGSVLSAISEENIADMDDFAVIKRLSSISGTALPKGLMKLKEIAPRFNEIIERGEMKQFLFNFLDF